MLQKSLDYWRSRVHWFHLSKRLLSLGASVLGFDVLTEYYDVSLKEERLKILSKFPAFTFVKGDLADEKQCSRFSQILSRKS